jgi:hypothetical protein
MRNEHSIQNSRVKNAEVLLPLTEIKTYIEFKNNQKEEYKNISNLICDISRHSENYPSIKRLIWELWAYGFDIDQAIESINRNYEIDEVVKLTDLMLSTHFIQSYLLYGQGTVRINCL